MRFGYFFSSSSTLFQRCGWPNVHEPDCRKAGLKMKEKRKNLSLLAALHRAAVALAHQRRNASKQEIQPDYQPRHLKLGGAQVAETAGNEHSSSQDFQHHFTPIVSHTISSGSAPHVPRGTRRNAVHRAHRNQSPGANSLPLFILLTAQTGLPESNCRMRGQRRFFPALSAD